MTENFRIKDQYRDSSPSQSEDLIEFPARFRVRCPHCSSERKAPKNKGKASRYSCQSTDQARSALCVQRAKERYSENLIADARAILGKFRFGAPAPLCVVE